MNKTIKEMFLRLWKEYFDDAELPIAFYYTDGEKVAENDPSTVGHCLIADLVLVREGTPLRFGADFIGCQGGRRYTGFSKTMADNSSISCHAAY